MTTEQFKQFQKTGKYTPHPVSTTIYESQTPTPNQAFSVRELMLRQAQGLPMPNLRPSRPLAPNGLDQRNLPATAHISADIIDAHSALKSEQKQLAKNQRSIPKKKNDEKE